MRTYSYLIGVLFFQLLVPQGISQKYPPEHFLQLIKQNKYQEAEEKINRYCPPDTCPAKEMADVFHQLGLYYYYEFADDTNAIKWYKRALIVWQKHLRKGDRSVRPKIANEHHNIGVSYKYLYSYLESLRHLEKAVSLRKELSSKDLAYTYSELGIVNDEIGEYFFAEEYYQQSIKQLDTSANLSLYAFILQQQGILLRKQKEYKAMSVLRNAVRVYQKINDTSGSAGSQLSLGYAYLDQRQYEKAYTVFQQALVSFQQLEEHNNIGHVYLGIGIYHKYQKQISQAFKAFQKALVQYQKASPKDPINFAAYHDNMGDLYRIENKPKQALQAYHKAIKIACPLFKTDDLYQVPELDVGSIYGSNVEALTFLSSKASAFYQLYQDNGSREALQASLAYFKVSVKLIDIIRHTHTETLSKLFWRKEVRHIYEEALKVAYEIGTAEEAFYFMEKSKAAILADALRRAQAMHSVNVPDSLIRLERDFQFIRYTKTQELFSASTKEKVDIQKELSAHAAKYEKFRDSLKNNYPAYYQYLYKESDKTIKDVQIYLPDAKTVLIEYFVGDETTFMLSVSKNRPPQLKFIPTKELGPLAKETTQLMKNIKPAATKKLLENLYQLHSMIITPLISDIPTKLYILPDGFLHFISFGALLTSPLQLASNEPKDITAAAKNAQYLALETAILYSYSTEILLDTLINFPKRYTSQLGAFAPAFIDSKKSLPALKQGLYDATNHLDSEIYMDQDATEEQFCSRAHLFSILQVVTHSEVDTSDWFSTYIEFTHKSESITNDGRLYTEDIYELELNARLILLTACTSGSGKLELGEGIMSIARAFRYAGISNALVGLWKINDKATLKIIKSFYQHLGTGCDKSVALQRAIKEYINEGNSQKIHPYYWAAFAMVGDDIPVVESSNNRYMGNTLLSLGIIICTILFIAYRYRRRE